LRFGLNLEVEKQDMKTRKLGTLKVSELGFGCMNLATNYGPAVPIDEAQRAEQPSRARSAAGVAALAGQKPFARDAAKLFRLTSLFVIVFHVAPSLERRSFPRLISYLLEICTRRLRWMKKPQEWRKSFRLLHIEPELLRAFQAMCSDSRYSGTPEKARKNRKTRYSKFEPFRAPCLGSVNLTGIDFGC
jgi:hypothetical protein